MQRSSLKYCISCSYTLLHVGRYIGIFQVRGSKWFSKRADPAETTKEQSDQVYITLFAILHLTVTKI